MSVDARRGRHVAALVARARAAQRDVRRRWTRSASTSSSTAAGVGDRRARPQPRAGRMRRARHRARQRRRQDRQEPAQDDGPAARPARRAIRRRHRRGSRRAASSRSRGRSASSPRSRRRPIPARRRRTTSSTRSSAATRSSSRRRPRARPRSRCCSSSSHAELDRIGAPRDLVLALPSPVDREHTRELMRQADLVVATGSQANVRAAYESGTPALGVGVGNVAGDRRRDRRRRRRRAQDRALEDLRSRDELLVREQRDRGRVGARTRCSQALAREGGVLLDARARRALAAAMLPDGKLSPAVIGAGGGDDRAPRAATLDRARARRRRARPGRRRGRRRRRAPVLRREALAGAGALSRARLRSRRGAGRARSRATRAPATRSACTRTRPSARSSSACTLPVCRVIVNQAHCFATGGSFDNALPFSLSMGCGTWGGNSFSDNLNYRHFLNITRVVHPIRRARARADRGRALRRLLRARTAGHDAGSRLVARGSIERAAPRATRRAVSCVAPETRRVADVTASSRRSCLARRRGRCASAGIAPGDVVVFMLPNGLSALRLLLGAMDGGYVVVPVNLLAQDAHLELRARPLRPRVVFAAPESEARGARDAPRGSRGRASGRGRPRPTTGALPPAAPRRSPAGAAALPDRRRRCSCTRPARPACRRACCSRTRSMLARRRAGRRRARPDAADRVLSSLPLYHINGQCIATMLAPLVSGGSIVMPHRFSVSQWWPLVERYRPTWLNVVPTIIAYLLNGPDPTPRSARPARGVRFAARRRRRCRPSSSARSSRASASPSSRPWA